MSENNQYFLRAIRIKNNLIMTSSSAVMEEIVAHLANINIGRNKIGFSVFHENKSYDLSIIPIFESLAQFIEYLEKITN